ncbi:hypothetical protein D0962_19410 [Leptolyngbyaceae cyanobacterium CCMR0082]|uniref:Uncharacterized protein n=1 Tax=Adonisia turfae CCMR0082 TaxID=2304604 RepID=A0A6M0S8X5_9CYAN|nr:DUF6629 family protein [Adonisia turfae]NEZ64928.1 hypothetical protein [Adonisia turfae CCMR0082]
MCFSATASFTAATLLIPAGLYACKLAIDIDLRYLPGALIPCIFGIQQGFEGIEWLAIHGNQADTVHLAALGYLVFSHGFWPIWFPLTVFAIVQRPWAKKLLLVVTLLGALFGMSLYVPLLLSPDMFSVTVIQGSIHYQTTLIYDQFFPRNVSRLIYLLIVAGPFWLCDLTEIRGSSGVIALALLVTYWFYNYAFISVWCFFAAILSINIIFMLRSIASKKLLKEKY